MDDQEYLLGACYAALNSPDPSTQNGAVLVDMDGHVIANAWNEFPMGVAYLPERWERPAKYGWIEHAERNAIYSAARMGCKTRGSTLYCPWAACADCARAIVQAGVFRLVRVSASDNTNERWLESIKQADTIMYEAGVTIVEYPTVPGCPELRRDGKLITL